MTGRSALVAYESMFGNTAIIASAVSDGLRGEGYDVSCVNVAAMPGVSPDRYDLVVVGAPTHAFSLSRRRTRDDAVRQGALPIGVRIGIREWIGTLPATTVGRPPAAVFDTRMAKARRMPSAGRAAARLMRGLSFRLLLPVAGFTVTDVKGPLTVGELRRATDWGHTVGQTAAAAKGPADHGT